MPGLGPATHDWLRGRQWSRGCPGQVRAWRCV